MLQQRREGQVLVLTLDNPAQRNALAVEMVRQLAVALEQAELDRDLRAIVITGAGGTFSAGGDLSDMDFSDQLAARNKLTEGHRLARAVVKGAKPVIAAVEGWAAGAGLSTAMLCDTVIAGEGTRFVASFAKVGVVGDIGLLHTLPRRVGYGRARQILLYAEPVAADEALRIGLVDAVVPKGQALQAALARAQAFSALAPLSATYAKAFLAQGLDAALDWEREAQATLFRSSDFAEGVRAFFEKRAAAFTGA